MLPSGLIVTGGLYEQLLLPVVEVPAEVGDGLCGYGDVAVVESGQGSEHGGQDGRVESGVDLGCAFEQEPDVLALCDVVDIGEVAGFGAVEEGEQLPAGEFFECERGAGGCPAATVVPQVGLLNLYRGSTSPGEHLVQQPLFVVVERMAVSVHADELGEAAVGACGSMLSFCSPTSATANSWSPPARSSAQEIAPSMSASVTS